MVFSQDNITDDNVIGETGFKDNSSQILEIAGRPKVNTEIDVYKNISYSKDGSNFECYLKDENNKSIENRTLKIEIANESYECISDKNGKITLALNLNPNTYDVNVTFGGSDDLNASDKKTSLKIKKTPLSIKMSNYNTYFASDLFFKVKVFNSDTKTAVSGIKVKFIVYNIKTKKYCYYYAISNKDGYAILNKNLKVGTYKMSTQICDSKKYISYKNSNKKVTMKVKPTKEFGCCSFYLQVSGTESIAGFRRDGTEAVNILIKNVKWYGKSALKQYKNNYGYFFHSITTADGWMLGNGGIEGKSICLAIEKLAGQMVKSNQIKTSTLKKIQKYKKKMDFGHFSIKAPNGKFAVVWKNKIIVGKLKPGEFFSSPNGKSDYRHGKYIKFSSNPVKAAIKVGATDKYGINRRDITIFHWKSTTDKNYKTTSSIKCYAANDNGKLVGRSTAKLKDNIYFKTKFTSKNKLPISPKYMFLGTHSFGNIDKLVKTPTVINAPEVINKFNTTAYFKISVKNKKTNAAVSGIKIRLNISFSNDSVIYTLKTDKNGVAQLNTNSLAIGNYAVNIAPANNKYLISAKSGIVIQ